MLLPRSETAAVSAPLPDPANAPAESVVARRRRDEIVQAATDIIASEGLHRLSLGRIERRTRMSRGQLTYYFPAKEAILLAVFDRMLARMIAGAVADAERQGLPASGPRRAWTRLRHGLVHMLTPDASSTSPAGPDPALGALVHTFMAQVTHRPDYRRRLAEANADWRAHITADVSAARSPGSDPRTNSPAAVASVVMALFQGLTDQLAVDPAAFDRPAVLDVCLRMLAPFVSPPGDPETVP